MRCHNICFKDIRPFMSLLSFKFLAKNLILDIIMFYLKVLLSAQFIICDSHWKYGNLRKYIKAQE